MSNFDNIAKSKGLKIFSKAFLIFSSFVFGVSLVGGHILLENEDAVNAAFGISTSKIETTNPDPNEDNYYYKSSFKSVKEVRHNGEVYNESIVKEGTTLLKNEKVAKDGNKPALPLKENAKVSLFSTSSAQALISTTLSAGKDTVTLQQGLEKQGIMCNPELAKWYSENFTKYGRKQVGSHVGSYMKIGDAKWDEISTEAKTNAEYGDAAIFVISRGGGEGRDLMIASSSADIRADMTDGNYLKLSPKERDVLEHLKAEKDKGTFKKIIVLFNAANQVQCDFLDDPTLGIDAAVWAGVYGQYGARALGKIFAGTVNPSGKLPDTYWKKHYLNPVHANWSVLANDSEAYGQSSWLGDVNKFDSCSVVYQEGMYMGYRYTETRYEDKVLGVSKNTDFDYNETVSYPFGHGLSYTTFDYTDFNVNKVFKNEAAGIKENQYVATVKVTNTGDVAGKESVQLYAQKPYTDYDRTNHIAKPSVELVGFEKTKILEPGKSEVLKIVIPERSLTSYDAWGHGTYILEKGTHYLTAGKNAHAAVNNILADKGKTTADGMTENGDAKLAYKIDIEQTDAETYSVSAVESTAQGSFGKHVHAKITNQFDKADIKRYTGEDGIQNSFDYISRDNWDGTTHFGLTDDNTRTGDHVKLMIRKNEQIMADFSEQQDPHSAGKGTDPYPTYGSKKTAHQLIDLRAYKDNDNDPTNDVKIPYDDPMWDELLDQLTIQEQDWLLKCGYRKTQALPSIGKPETIDQNGGTGVIVNFNILEGINRGFAVLKKDDNRGKKPVIYCCNGIVAATMNKKLTNFYGRQWGEDMLWCGLQGLYGMGVNTHRSPYGGRNYHYYSEDPLLTGKIAASVTQGIATRGAYVYLKHAFLNDQETYRQGVRTWANEQTCREIYLKTFQIAIEEGGANCVMTSMNSIGAYWSGGQGFCNNVLRNEFGMEGHVVTDTYTAYRGSYTRSIFYGNDLPDGTRQNWENLDFVWAEPHQYSGMAWAIRESCHRILYNTVHSFAMNGISSNSRVVLITPSWVKAVNGVTTTSIVLFSLSTALFVGLLGYDIYGKAKVMFKKEDK